MPELIAFTAIDWFNIHGRGLVATVRLDRETRDFAHLIRQHVVIDGKTYLCRGVERHCHTAPWREGEPIGLLVSELEANPPSQGEFMDATRIRQLAEKVENLHRFRNEITPVLVGRDPDRSHPRPTVQLSRFGSVAVEISAEEEEDLWKRFREQLDQQIRDAENALRSALPMPALSVGIGLSGGSGGS